MRSSEVLVDIPRVTSEVATPRERGQSQRRHLCDSIYREPQRQKVMSGHPRAGGPEDGQAGVKASGWGFLLRE